MGLRSVVQNILDTALLQYGIASHHLRRMKLDSMTDADGNAVTINADEYVVYKITSGGNRSYGDGKPFFEQSYISINYYYRYDKNDAITPTAESRVNEIMLAFAADGRFMLTGGQSDVYDADNPYRGINVEFKYIGVINNG